MYTKKHCHSFAHSALLLTAIHALPAAAAGEPLLEFDFDDGLGGFENAANFEHAALSTLPWTTAKGSLSNFTGDPGLALAARNYADGNTLELEIVIADGWSLTIDSVRFDHFASASGPKSWTLEIDGQAYDGGNTPASFGHVNADIGLSLSAATLQIALSGAAADSNNGTYRIDNFVLNGTLSAVPLPPGALLLPPALLALTRRRRY